MATKLEENFVLQHVGPGTVMEFGSGDNSFANRFPGPITAIDLYNNPHSDHVEFLQEDVLKLSSRRWDNIIALSSFEHAGIETYHFTNKCSDESELESIAKKLVSLLVPGGRLLITVPFGTNEVYFVDKDGKNGTREEIPEPVWGFRTFEADTLVSLFSPLVPIVQRAYQLTNREDYFNPASWTETPTYNHEVCDNKRRGLLCIYLKKGNQ